MIITGHDIADAFVRSEPSATRWHNLPIVAKLTYNDLAIELSKLLVEDTITIAAVRCPDCEAMLVAEHCEHHACWEVNA
jgi:hypothetical protein